MKTKRLLPLVLLALSHGALAQQVPGAGSQLQQLPPTPAPRQAAPDIRIEETGAPTAPGAGSVRVLVKALHVTGEHVFSESKLLAVSGFQAGSQLSLADLQVMASRITEFYHSHGYFVARAFLPAQKVTGNVVTIEVSEGRYGRVTLRNSTNLSNRLAQSKLDGLNSGDPITIKPLESHLLLLSDVPGVRVSSTLAPGASPGTSDLIVNLTPAPRVSGSVDADNAGNPYTGVYRVGATVNLNNPLGLGDVASLRVLTSGRGLRYGRASYQMQIDRATVGVAYSKLDYVLGKQFAPLGAHGSAEVASIYGSYPLLRSRDSNLTVGLVYEDKRFQDVIDLFHSVTDRTAHVVTGQLYGSHRDGFGGGGVSSFFVGLSAGSLNISTPAARMADAAGPRTEGAYYKLWFNAARAQRVTDLVSLYASVTGQLASTNLDPSEKLVLGGMEGIRAYPQGEGFGDEGYLASLEARLLLARLSEHVVGQVHLLGFVDTGHITINKDPWYVGSNSRTLSSVGVGASWDDPGDFSVRAYYARKLGGESAMSAPDRSGRFWIQVIKYF
ncbi:ShlB/FhaC/HecB family hemolysin secretion/activation protein [Rhodanobacter ginsengisoli]|uniref:ShlB/FhaC/HecB family hemolysin secretion/activation protein n=1 Tax=Rhodanobacter ginsengisoli TaxID=418646 RepID=A0ABW0QP24_9GAMM